MRSCRKLDVISEVYLHKLDNKSEMCLDCGDHPAVGAFMSWRLRNWVSLYSLGQ